MREKTPIINELLAYKKEENLILSMPGNKGGIGFLRDDIGKELVNNLGFLDITEVDPLDNLHNPEGIIKESQELLAKTYGVKKGYFLVNGSTSGNLASIFSAFSEGDEVLVERNCHKSIYNGLILRKLKPVYIEANVDSDNDILLPCTEENILEAFKQAKNPKGIILTMPNYYGISTNLDNLILVLKKKGLKVVVDAAHGAHYGFNDKLPKGVYHKADYIVTSAHKTLPSLTQGAYLLVNDKESNVQFYISAFNTTSPSYLIMASLEYGRYYLDEYGQGDYEALIGLAEKYKDKINSLNKIKVLSNVNLQKGYINDKSRYVFILPRGYSGNKLLDYLRGNKIQSEMSFSRGVVLLLSPFNKEVDFKKIYDAIDKLDINTVNEEQKNIQLKTFKHIKRLEPFQVYDMKYEEMCIKNSVGKISKDFIIPYPPGIPIVLPGEEITEEIIEGIEIYKKSCNSILGLEEDKVKVIT